MVMNLSLPTHLLSIEYNTFDDLINVIQVHASSEEYAVIRLCIKKSYFTSLIEICYLYYDRGRKKCIPTGQFSIVAKFRDNLWIIREIRNPHHNHLTTITAPYPSLRKLNFTPAITSEVERATKVNIKPVAIIKSICLRQVEGFDNNESIYKTKDIYNIKAELHCKNLNVLSLIQILMQRLDGFSWLVFLFFKKLLSNFFIEISHFKKILRNT